MRVSARVYDVKGGAIFSKNNFFGTTHGDAWTPRLRSPSLIMAPGFAQEKCRVNNADGWHTRVAFEFDALSLTYKRNLSEHVCALNARIFTKIDEGRLTICLANGKGGGGGAGRGEETCSQ